MNLVKTMTLALMLAVPACATVPPDTRSGFLEDYAKLQPDPADTSLLWWEREGFDWTAYDAVFVEPLEFDLSPAALDQGIKEAELEELSGFFRQALIDELGASGRLADTIGPGVLRASIVVTDIDMARPVLNAATTLLLFVPLDRGGASVEMAFHDGATGELAAMGIDRKSSQVTDLAGGFQRYSYARQALREWTRELHQALQTNP